jgi:hypothetical protein
MQGYLARILRALSLMLAWQLPRTFENRARHTDSISREKNFRRRLERRERQTFMSKRPPKRLVQRGGHLSSKPRDKRFANQRMLRRMFRND